MKMLLINSNFKIYFHNWYQFHLQDISFLITVVILYLSNVSQPQRSYKSWYACLYWYKKLISLKLSHQYPFQKSILLRPSSKELFSLNNWKIIPRTLIPPLKICWCLAKWLVFLPPSRSVLLVFRSRTYWTSRSFWTSWRHRL